MWSAGGFVMGIFLGCVTYIVGWGWGSQGCKKGNHLLAENQISMFACVWNQT